MSTSEISTHTKLYIQHIWYRTNVPRYYVGIIYDIGLNVWCVHVNLLIAKSINSTIV